MTMATKNSDGTVVLKTTGRQFRDSNGTLRQTVGLNAKSIGQGGGQVYAGQTDRVGRPGWRIVTRTER
jgi:hypothetical protein